MLEGRDTLAVLPTGYGKSAIYQLAAHLLDGPALVVEPLIALQHDQAEKLEENGVGEPLEVNSELGVGERREALRETRNDREAILFTTPEQLEREDVRRSLRAAKPALLVVDEAHCISEWGHDFRPAYLRLGEAVQALGHPRVLALTATATPPVRDEIALRLGLQDPRVIVRGFDRQNLWFGVTTIDHVRQRTQALLEAVREAEKPGIVYSFRRRDSEELSEALDAEGHRASAYHAGLRKRRRREVQDAFMDGGLDVVCATTAFGLGVDKPDVRFVFHRDLPDSLDSYYQEAGRAGRDGRPAVARLFHSPREKGRSRFRAGGGDEERRRWERSRAEMMAAYAEQTGCRRAFILAYLGEPFDPPCGRCDACDAGRGGQRAAAGPAPRTRVRHSEFGDGTVLSAEGGAVTVLFERAGYHTLDWELARKRGLVALV